ncbi:NAD(P)H-dependent oxidoreductase [Caballeronia sp. 15711]|uniref:NAD(P)H-dependent oxidoreductase n=1 Tax=Caballeronia sp. 15711 TaxID=3391029 RepID=UPI0039E5B79C
MVGGAISQINKNYAIELSTTRRSLADLSQEDSISLSEGLIEELESLDSLVIGTPMRSFTVPSARKAWIDHIV